MTVSHLPTYSLSHSLRPLELGALDCCSLQAIGNGAPFTLLRQLLDHNQIGARFIALVQLGVNRPGERFRIMRDNRDTAQPFAGGNSGMSNHVAFGYWPLAGGYLPAQVLFVTPGPHHQPGFWRIMFSQQSRAFQHLLAVAEAQG